MAESKLTRLSLYYAVAYLLSGGAMLLAAPTLALRLFFSSHPDAYGDVLPRMAGAVTFALGVLVLQVIRHRAHSLHATLIGVRVFLVACWVWLFFKSGDPFFLTLAAMVGLGVILSSLAWTLDRRGLR